MKIARLGLLALCALVALAGVIWMGQGSGYIPYPAQSFMINQTPWIWRGALTALAGIIGFVVVRRL